jgi:Domain of unknown function (DUF3786)/Putative Fe-S cluster
MSITISRSSPRWEGIGRGEEAVNAIELYKKLPKTNCRKCGPKTCLPFALAVIKGDADLSECPFLPEEEIAALKASLKTSDWREELIAKLKEEVANLSLAGIAAGIGGVMRGKTLSLTCLGREFLISPEGDISTPSRITPWIKILLLHYIRTAGSGGLSGTWVSYGELKGGMVKASSFHRECEEPLRELFERDRGKVGNILGRLGAERCGGFPTENAWQLSLLPKIPVAILFWPAEEEFPSRTTILFDSTADRFLDAESLIFLVEGMVKNIEYSP